MGVAMGGMAYSIRAKRASLARRVALQAPSLTACSPNFDFITISRGVTIFA